MIIVRSGSALGLCIAAVLSFLAEPVSAQTNWKSAPRFVEADWVKDGAVVIDVGINRIEEDGASRLVGDVDFDAVSAKASAITPVPGGVGPMTIACLMYNTVAAAKQQRDLSD